MESLTAMWSCSLGDLYLGELLLCTCTCNCGKLMYSIHVHVHVHVYGKFSEKNILLLKVDEVKELKHHTISR